MNKIVLKYKKIELLNTNHICIIYVYYIFTILLLKNRMKQYIIIGITSEWVLKKGKLLFINKYNRII